MFSKQFTIKMIDKLRPVSDYKNKN